MAIGLTALTHHESGGKRIVPSGRPPGAAEACDGGSLIGYVSAEHATRCWLILGLIVALLALLIWDRFRTWGVQTRLIPGLLHQVHLSVDMQ